MSQQTLYTLYTLYTRGARWKSSFGSDCTQIREFSWSGVRSSTVVLREVLENHDSDRWAQRAVNTGIDMTVKG